MSSGYRMVLLAAAHMRMHAWCVNIPSPLFVPDTETVLQMVEAHHHHCQEFSQWLTDFEELRRDCGPIGADLQRLEHQEGILEVSAKS